MHARVRVRCALSVGVQSLGVVSRERTTRAREGSAFVSVAHTHTELRTLTFVFVERHKAVYVMLCT